MQVKVMNMKNLGDELEEKVVFMFTPSEGENVQEIIINCSEDFHSLQVVNLGENEDNIATFLIRQNK